MTEEAPHLTSNLYDLAMSLGVTAILALLFFSTRDGATRWIFGGLTLSTFAAAGIALGRLIGAWA